MASDDYSPRPIAPSLDRTNDIEQTIVDPTEKALADVAQSPQWAEVEKIFNEELESLEYTFNIDPSLPANEYKTIALANTKASAIIKSIWGRVLDAAEAERERTGGN